MTNLTFHTARTSPDLGHVNTLDLMPEVQKILLCEGVEFHNTQSTPVC